MARKRKYGKKQGQPKHSPEFQAANALKALQEEHYKSAISAYKELLKREQRQDWLDHLARAYEGRAWELAAKGMFREAVAIWQNRAQTCNQPLLNVHYLLWMLQSGLTDQAMQLFREDPQALGVDAVLFRTHLAALALCGQHSVLEQLPDDDPVVSDYATAMEALQAYCNGDETELNAILTKIAYRSPYRDLRTLLKLLVELPTNPEQASKILVHIDRRSPFATLAQTTLAASYEGEEFLNRLKPLDQAERGYILALKGWPQSHLEFLQALISLHQSSSGERFLLRFLIKQQQNLGADYARQTALRVLVHHPDGMDLHDREFGSPSLFHKSRVLALMQEGLRRDPYNLYHTWNEALKAFYHEFDASEKQNLLRAALIQRRIADLLERFDFDQELLLEVLQKSLQDDPDDLPTYLRLIRLYREDKRFKEARRIQEQALARYPQNPEVFLAIVETSLASNAFKKAVYYAERVLEIDPINSRVRKILFDAHMAHACKQIKQHKPALALKELEQAVQWDTSEQARIRVELIRGIMELPHNVALGRKRLQVAMAQMDYSLSGRFLLLMEVARLQRNGAHILRQAQLPKVSRDRQQVIELIHTLQKLPENEENKARQALRTLQDPLKQAAKVPYTESEMGLICETFKRFKESDLRLRYARAALERWPGRPLFVFHRCEAQPHLHFSDFKALENAIELAQEEGDMRTTHRIIELLESTHRFGKPKSPTPHGPPFDEHPAEAIDELFEELGTKGLLDLLEATGIPELDIIRQEFGDENIRELFEAMANGEDPDKAMMRIMLSQAGKPRSRRGGMRKKPKNPKARDNTRERDTDTEQLDLF